MKTTYYPRTLKSIIVALSDLFNDIYVYKYSSGNTSGATPIEKIYVPITFGPMDKAYSSRIENHEYVVSAHDAYGYIKSTESGKRYYLQIPRMSLVLNGLAYASDRAYGVNEWREWFAQTVKLKNSDIDTILRDNQPTPMDFNFTLYIKSDAMDYLAQILENILPYFNPKLFLRVKEFSFLNIERDLPVHYNGVSTDFVDDMANPDKRYVNASIDLTVEGYMYRPWEYAKIIKVINTSFFVADDIASNSGVISASYYSTSAINIISAGTSGTPPNSAILGGVYHLNWQSVNLPSTEEVIIDISYTSGFDWITLNSGFPNSGSYSWNVTGVSAGEVLYFRISDSQQPLDINAISNPITVINYTSGINYPTDFTSSGTYQDINKNYNWYTLTTDLE